LIDNTFIFIALTASCIDRTLNINPIHAIVIIKKLAEIKSTNRGMPHSNQP